MTALRQMLRYAMTGGIAAVVDIGLFHVLVRSGGDILLSAGASFLVAAAVNYGLTSAFVFPVAHRSLRQATRFLLVASLGLVLNTGITTGLYAAGLAPTVAKTVAVGIVFFFNFFANRRVVFHPMA